MRKPTVIPFVLTIDEDNSNVSFADKRRTVPLITMYGTTPACLSAVCRAAAAHFLEMAYNCDRSADFIAPEYTAEEAARQFSALLRENASPFEEVNA